jgi:hypothetical protein
MRWIARMVVLIGAAGSLHLMFNASRNQKSVFLIVCFAVWVLSPFVALIIATVISKPWPIHLMTLFLLILFISIGSLVSYGDALPLFQLKPNAFKFLIVPLISWLLILIVIRMDRKKKGAS